MKMIAGALLLRLLEEVAYAGRADSHDRLDELGRSHREKRSVRLAGDGTREQRLSGTGRAGEEDAVRDPAAQLAVLVRVAEEVDDLAQLLLGLVDARDVCEGDLVAGRLVAASTRSSERAEDVLHAAGPAEQPEQEEDEENRRPEAEQQRLPPRRAPFERLGVDGDVVLLEELGQLVGVCEGGNLRPESRRRLRLFERHPLLEGALDVRPLGRDLLDVGRLHLLQEERAVRDSYPRGGLHRPARDEQVEREQRDEEDDPAS